MYHYILFDLDGTLTDSKEGILNCVRYALNKLNRLIRMRKPCFSSSGLPFRIPFRSSAA